MVNRDGRAVAPTPASLMAAAANANWEATPGFGVILTDMPGAESWPFASASFIVMLKRPEDAAATREALKFFAWAFAKGDRLATEMLYVPMPDNVVGAIQRLCGPPRSEMPAEAAGRATAIDPPDRVRGLWILCHRGAAARATR